MEDRRQEISRILFQWVGIPLMLGLVGFFFVGPSIGGRKPERKTVTQPSHKIPPVVAVRDEPKEREEWVQPDPPQVSISVTDTEEEGDEEETDELIDEDLPVPPPIQFSGDEGDIDEAGIGGLMRPPVKNDVDDDTDDSTDDSDDGSGVDGESSTSLV